MRRTVIAILLIGMVAAFAQADVISVGANQDNTVQCQSTNPGYVVPNGETLEVVRKYSTNYAKRIWISFDLSSVDYDAESSADFAMTFVQKNFTPAASEHLKIWALKSGFVPDSGILGTDWQETAITWNNAPGNDTTSTYHPDSSLVTQIATYDELSSLTAGQSVGCTIGKLGDYLQADESVTIVATLMSYSDGHNLTFASSENTTYAGPSLSVTVPEPATMSLLAIGGLAALIKRK